MWGVEPFLDVDRSSRVLEYEAHLLGDVHEQVVENLELYRIDRGANGGAIRERHDAVEHKIAGWRRGRSPAGFDDGGRRVFNDYGGTIDLLVRTKAAAIEERGLALRSIHDRREHTDRFGRRCGWVSVCRCQLGVLGLADCFDLHRLDDERPFRRGEAKPSEVHGFEGRLHRCDIASLDSKRRVRALVANRQPPHGHDLFGADALGHDRLATRRFEDLPPIAQIAEHLGRKSIFDRGVGHVTDVGETDSDRREHAGVGMNHDPLDAQAIGHKAGVLTTGTAEAHKRVLRDVVAPLHRDLLDRVRHVVDRYGQEALGNRFRRLASAGRRLDVGAQRVEPVVHDRFVERLVAIGPEHRGEEVGSQLAEQHVAIGDRQRSPVAVAGRTGVGASRVGSDPQATAVEMQDRTTARGDRVDVNHGRSHPDAGDLGFLHPLVLTGIVRHVGRCATHVEADDPVEARGLGGSDHADDATCGPREQRVLALEVLRIGQAAVRLHEQQPGADTVGPKTIVDLGDVATKDRREVSVDNRRVAARDQFHQRVHLVADRDLAESDRTGDRSELSLVFDVAIAMKQHDRHRVIPRGPDRHQLLASRVGIERLKHLALRAEPFIDFDHVGVQHLGQHDVEIEQAGSSLVTDAQRVGESLCRHKCGRFAFAFEQRVRRDGCTHLHRADAVDGQRLTVGEVEQIANALHRGIVVTARVLGQQLVRGRRSVGVMRDEVGERAAAIDPEVDGRLGN